MLQVVAQVPARQTPLTHWLSLVHGFSLPTHATFLPLTQNLEPPEKAWHSKPQSHSDVALQAWVQTKPELPRPTQSPLAQSEGLPHVWPIFLSPSLMQAPPPPERGVQM